MKLILAAAAAAVLLASAARAAVPCQLSAQDYAAVLSSSSQLDQSSIEALPADQAQVLCSTRSFAKKVAAGNGKIQKSEKYSPFYLSPKENIDVSNAVDALIERQLEGNGVLIG